MELDVNSPEFQRAWARIIGEAWADPELRARLQEDPDGVFRDHGVEIPDGVELSIDTSLFSPLIVEKIASFPVEHAVGMGTVPVGGPMMPVTAGPPPMPTAPCFACGGCFASAASFAASAPVGTACAGCGATIGNASAGTSGCGLFGFCVGSACR